MSVINVNNLTFSYEKTYDNIFENMSFSIDTDWKLGFIARNGRGKTTFLNILRGKYEYSGTITANTEFRYFPVEVTEKMLSKTPEEILSNEFPNIEFWKVLRELNVLGMDCSLLYREFGTLSYGERTRVMLAYLFAGENSFLLLDEPTNHLDIDSRNSIKEYLKCKKGFILVSHDRDILDACTDHVLVINKTDIQVEKGNFTTWWENKEKRDNYELERNESLKKDIGRLSESARRTAAWAEHVENTKIGYNPINEHDRFLDTRAYIGEKSRRMQMRKKNMMRRIDNEIDEKRSLLKNIESVKELKLYPERFYKNTLIDAKRLRIINKELTFQLNVSDRVILCGHNGCGKSTLIRTILSELPADGELSVCRGIKISYVPQNASFLSGSLRGLAEERQIDYTLLLAVLSQLDFSRKQFEKKIDEYSEGQKKKVIIAASLCEKANLYIWDEPLNYIDVFSRMQIEKLILKFQPTMLLVEHDTAFINKIATKKINFDI